MLTDQQHPITPPPELVEEWCDEWYRLKVRINTGIPEYVATQAARWGADQELEACSEWLLNSSPWTVDPNERPEWVQTLKRCRRPKPPSLAEEALTALDEVNEWAVENMRQFAIHDDLVAGVAAIRYALERLQELENNG